MISCLFVHYDLEWGFNRLGKRSPSIDLCFEVLIVRQFLAFLRCVNLNRWRIEDVTQVRRGSRLLFNEVEWEFWSFESKVPSSLIDDSRTFLRSSAGVQVWLTREFTFEVPNVYGIPSSSGVRILIGIRGIHVCLEGPISVQVVRVVRLGRMNRVKAVPKRLLELISAE
ncbi:hypothetical protein TNIN_157251 [Trichonephila inaurata madagascariensis]|uniref:Uncharacterized protein n=1 Tax=Trichonephila inaurata madagascariensis TaxID=2747483 RepID=A0A8X6YNQ0_9ARAC|nr:hypothetical protein TNIN_157251 [Trichonephila inaurata madagascariensis]